MVGASGKATATRQPYSHGDRYPLPVMELGGHIDQLVEAAGDEIGKLHLTYRAHALNRRPHCSSDNSRFRQWSIPDPFFPEFLDKPIGHLEGPTECSDVFT